MPCPNTLNSCVPGCSQIQRSSSLPTFSSKQQQQPPLANAQKVEPQKKEFLSKPAVKPTTCKCSSQTFSLSSRKPDDTYAYPQKGRPTETELEITINISVDDNDATDQNTYTSLSLTYEDDSVYDEPYMHSLIENDTAAAIQTDLVLGDKLESLSLSSIAPEQEEDNSCHCSSKTALPWGKITLPLPGTYNIKPVKEFPQEIKVESLIQDSKDTNEPVPTELNIDENEGNDQNEETEQTTEVDETEVEDLSSVVSEQIDETPPPAEPEPLKKYRKKKEKLLYEDEIIKHNEPYMDDLYKDFPNSDDENENCDSNTEMPWKDILLPENCQIKGIRKAKKCSCKNKENLYGTFLPSDTATNLYEVNDVIDIHKGFEEPTSTIIYVGQRTNNEIEAKISSASSKTAPQPKRCPKTYILQVDLNKDSTYSVSFKEAQENTRPTVNQKLSTTSQSVSVSTGQMFEDKPSSILVSIRPSIGSSCKSQTFPVTNDKFLPQQQAFALDKQKLINKLEPGKSVAKKTTSMPSMCSQGFTKSTGSSQKSKVVSKKINQEKNLTSDELNRCANIKNKTLDTQFQSQINEEVFSSAKCNCKSNSKFTTVKQDPVMAALDAYEAEMKPLKQALVALQEKIRNLNLPELKGCFCNTALISNTPTNAPFKPSIASYNNTCPYFQPASFQPKTLPYGYLPSPQITSYRQNYAPTTNQMRKPGCQQVCCCSRRTRLQGDSRHNTHRHKGHNIYDNPNSVNYRLRQQNCTYRVKNSNNRCPDFSEQGYSRDHVTHQPPYRNKQQNRIREEISWQSDIDLSDYSNCNSGSKNDLDENYGKCGHSRSSTRLSYRQIIKLKSCSRQSSKRHDKMGNSLVSCSDNIDWPYSQSGIAVKTDPDDFLWSTGLEKKSQGTSYTCPNTSSYKINTKIIYK